MEKMRIRLLFQGDSVTDEERDRSDIHSLGKGYAKFCAQMLTEQCPDIDFEFINLGIGGNKSADLLTRWQEDCIDVNPDIVCFMVGVNDVWHSYPPHNLNITPEQYSDNCEKMFVQLREKSNAKLVVMEPFLLEVPDKPFRERMNPNIDVIRRLAQKYADCYVPLDGLMAAAAVHTPIEVLTWDGVHPRDDGAIEIAHWATRAIKRVIREKF